MILHNDLWSAAASLGSKLDFTGDARMLAFAQEKPFPSRLRPSPAIGLRATLLGSAIAVPLALMDSTAKAEVADHTDVSHSILLVIMDDFGVDVATFYPRGSTGRQRRHPRHPCQI